jgi:nitric oxide reductase subunit B
LAGHYADVFRRGRPECALSDPVKQREMAAFFWGTSWAASTQPPPAELTYTQKWPPEPLIANAPTGPALVWSVICFVLLLAGVGSMVW